MSATIELIDLGRDYSLGASRVQALQGVSLRIEAGEYVAIVGPSGSGKSTLMNLLGCLDAPSSGHLLVNGLDTSRLNADGLATLRRQCFGFIFQRYHLLPHHSARDNVALPAVYAGEGLSARNARAQALLGRLGLGDRLLHRPHALSGGQQQRVCIARALMNGGEVVLADEPTGALDSQSGANLLALLDGLNAQGHTIILVTHDPNVAAHARRVIELRDGRVRHDSGTPAGHRTSAPAVSPGPRSPETAFGRLSQYLGRWREAALSAAESLRGNMLRSVLSMLGISIGIAAVVCIMALTSAARSSVEQEFRGLLSGRIAVWRGNPSLPPGSQALPFSPAEIDAVRALPGIRGVTADRESQMTARQASRDANVSVVGAEADTLDARKMHLVDGRSLTSLDDTSGAQVALIDTRARAVLFRSGESPLGKTLFLTPGMPGEAATGVSMPVTIVGVVSAATAGSSQAGNSMAQVLLPMRTFSRKLDPRLDADQFSVLLELSTSPASVRQNLTYRLKALHGIEDFESFNAEEEYRKVQQLSATLSLLLGGVGAIALLVGGVGVMNIMLVSVSERIREIGIRLAVGARPADVRLQFLVEAVLLCILGGGFGVLLSLLALPAINAVQDELRVQVGLGTVAVAFAVATLVGLAFGTLPAHRAAAMKPVDALARE